MEFQLAMDLVKNKVEDLPPTAHLILSSAHPHQKKKALKINSREGIIGWYGGYNRLQKNPIESFGLFHPNNLLLILSIKGC